MSLTALKLQVPINIPKRIRIEKPEIFDEVPKTSALRVFFKTILFLSYLFSFLAFSLFGMAYHLIHSGGIF